MTNIQDGAHDSLFPSCPSPLFRATFLNIPSAFTTHHLSKPPMQLFSRYWLYISQLVGSSIIACDYCTSPDMGNMKYLADFSMEKFISSLSMKSTWSLLAQTKLVIWVVCDESKHSRQPSNALQSVKTCSQPLLTTLTISTTPLTLIHAFTPLKMRFVVSDDVKDIMCTCDDI